MNNKKNIFFRLSKVLIIVLFLLFSFLSFKSNFLLVEAASFGEDFVEGEINLSNQDPRSMTAKIINVALSLLATVALVIVLYGGYVWMTSRGNEEKVNKAKDILKAGVIGLIIILASWGITTFVLNKLGLATGSISTSQDENGGGSSELPGSLGSNCGTVMDGVCILPDDDNCQSGLICNEECKCDYEGVGDPCGSRDESNVCDPDDSDCKNENLICDPNTCTCKSKDDESGGTYVELGDLCRSDTVCSENEGICNPNHGLTCDEDTCTCIGDPVITGISPIGGFCVNNINQYCENNSDCGESTCDKTTSNIAEGNLITIFGYNFDTFSESNSKIIFSLKEDPEKNIEGVYPNKINKHCINNWTNNKIIVSLPSNPGFQPGDYLDLELITKTERSDTLTNDIGPQIDLKFNKIIRPGICDVSPKATNSNQTIYYQGINLQGSQAYFGNTLNHLIGFYPNSFVSNTHGSAKVPNMEAGEISTFVKNNDNVASNFLNFNKTPDPPAGPSISYFSPEKGTAGQYVTIYGKNFGKHQGTSEVFFVADASSYTGDIHADFSFPPVCLQSIWSDNEILIKVPGLLEGPYKIAVIVNNKRAETINRFQIDDTEPLKPSLCKISPKSGPHNSLIHLWGEYFGNNLQESRAVFSNNKETAITTVSKEDNITDKISVNVPSGAVSGPVKVSRDGIEGNFLNFTVGSCSKDEDCSDDLNICCLPGTYNAGACVINENQCFLDTPATSSFEWFFSTELKEADIYDPNQNGENPNGDTNANSCLEYNFCPEGYVCPNSPGFCSNYEGGKPIEGGACKSNCSDFSDLCIDSGNNICSYNQDEDRCFSQKGCSLDKEFSYTLGAADKEQSYTKTATCKKFSVPNEQNPRFYYEISVNTICPKIAGTQWLMVSPGKCINVSTLGDPSTCSLCGSNYTCRAPDTNPNSDQGFCVSPRLCSGNFQCDNDKCIKKDLASCQCCCEKNENKYDNGGNPAGNPACCSPLMCDYECGESANPNPSTTDYGLCSGCRISETASVADRDLACNCFNVSGKYCEVNNQYPKGACLDCGSLNKTGCKEHNSTCCWDEKLGVCRGSASDSSIWGVNSNNYGYCPYYDCSPENTTVCAKDNPVINGNYFGIQQCEESCQKNCSELNLELCKDATACCWDHISQKCLGGNRYPTANTNDYNYGYCVYYQCNNPNNPNNPCIKTIYASQSNYSNEISCNNNCKQTSSSFGDVCFSSPTICDFNKCNPFTCLLETGAQGDQSDPTKSCGACCCKPQEQVDQCSEEINPKLNCVANKGLCSGPNRGLCCGCTADSDCSNGGNPLFVGCAIDTCCRARPKIDEESNVSNQSPTPIVDPQPNANNICRNAIIKVKFNQRIDALSLENNILLLQEKNSGEPCPAGSQKISFLSEDDYADSGFFNKIKSIIQRPIILASSLFNKKALAQGPSSNKTYCSVFGLFDFQHSGSGESAKTEVFFKPHQLLEAGSKYFVVVKGDKDLNSASGIKSTLGIGLKGFGYHNGQDWQNQNSLTFNQVVYEHAYAWNFQTLSANTPGQGVCEIDYVRVSPSPYLFTSNENEPSENDNNPHDNSFDSFQDRDKAFFAKTYSKDNQEIQGTSNYDWEFIWKVSNPQVLEFNNAVASWGVKSAHRLVQVKNGVQDGYSKISAEVEMKAGNIINTGNGYKGEAEAYVLLCKNPWPEIKTDGTWSPWKDDSSFSNYNYEFFYCRDSDSGTLLPKLLEDLVIKKGQSLIKVCSNNPAKHCSNNGDCPGGLCLASILKETYFFKQTAPKPVNLKNIIDNGSGGSLKIFWNSEEKIGGFPNNQVAYYDIHYSAPSMATNIVAISLSGQYCSLSNGIYECEYDLTGLTDQQPYNISISAHNSNNDVLGNSLSSSAIPTIIPFVSCGDPLCYNSYCYKTTEINSQCWMAENLRTEKFNDGGNIDYSASASVWSSKKIASYAWPSYKLDLGNSYGALYNYYVVQTGKVCPLGWHVSTRQEVDDLIGVNGGESEAGAYLKSTETKAAGSSLHPYWQAPNTGALNSSKFSALPAGWINDQGVFGNITAYFTMWTNQGNANNYQYMRLFYNKKDAEIKGTSKEFGLSIRCAQD